MSRKNMFWFLGHSCFLESQPLPLCVYLFKTGFDSNASMAFGAAGAHACLGAGVTDSLGSCSTTIFWDSVLTRYQECHMQMCQHNLVADMHIMHIISAHACFMVLSDFRRKTTFQR